MAKITRILFFLLFTFFSQNHGMAQFYKKLFQAEIDTNYIREYSRDVCARIYSSTKYANFNLRDKYYDKEIQYRPNGRNVIGFGATYDFLTINIGLIPVNSNRKVEEYGKTKYLDLQFHTYSRKFVVDFYLQKYKGFYIDNPQDVILDWTEGYPIRSDIEVFTLGLRMNYVYNNKRFSYKAAFVQNEWQRKSAGSLVFGLSFNTAKLNADSSLLPPDVDPPDFFRNYDFNRARLTNTSLNVGYIYSFIFLKHIFLTLSVEAGIGVGSTKIQDDIANQPEQKGIYAHGTTGGRVAIGYNSRRWYVGFSAVDAAFSSSTTVSSTGIRLGSGNLRLNIVRRFSLKRHPKVLDKIKL